MGQRIPEKEIANCQFNVFCNVADIIEGNGATSYFCQSPEQHAPALTNFQTARTDVIMSLTVSLHVEVVSLLQRLSNTRPKAITLDVEMEDYYRIKGARTND